MARDKMGKFPGWDLSSVVVFHPNLSTGGIVLYPSNRENPAKPKGKLRLVYETVPLAFRIE